MSYLEKLLPPNKFKPGSVTVVYVNHDTWCKLLKTGVPEDCTCEPDIKYEPLVKE